MTDLGSGKPPPTRHGDWITLGFLTALSAGVAIFGRALFLSGALETAVWPASGFVFALVFVSEGRLAPAALGGGLLAMLLTQGWDASFASIPLVSAAEALAARYLLRRAAVDPADALKCARVASWLLLTTVLVTTIGAGLQVAMALLAGHATLHDTGAALRLQIASEMVGALYTLTVYYGWRAPGLRDSDAGSAGEAAFVVAAFVLCGVAGFLLPWNRLGITTPSLILVVPIGIWAAMRLGARIPTTAAGALAVLATLGATRELGAFASPDRSPAQREFLVLIYLLAMIVTIVVVVSTVAEREETARREQETRRRLQFILDNTTDGIMLFRDDADGVARCVEINLQTAHHFYGGDAALARWSLLGRTRDEVVAELLGNDPNDRAEAQIQAAVAARSPAHRTMSRRTDRGVRMFDVSYSPIEDRDGTVRNVIVSMRDVTDRSRALEALRDSESRLATIYDHVSDCLSLWAVDIDGDTSLVSVNRATFEALQTDDSGTPAEAAPGWRMDLALGSRLVTLGVRDEAQHSALMATHAAKLREVLSACAPVRYDEVVDLRDGTHALEIELIPISGHGDVIAYVLRSARDVTERKRSEEARRTLEASLRQSQKLEAIGTLAGGIAHDFNNILAGILGNVELARADIEPQHPAADSLREVLRAVQRARDVVRQILTFSRTQEGKRHAVRLATVVREVLPLLRASLPSTTGIVTVVENEDAHVLADEVQLHQVLMNLCTNAAHAIGQRPGQISITQRTVTLDGAGRGAAREDRPGRLRHAVGARRRRRHRRRHYRADLRAVLHHQAAGRGNRPGAVGGARHRALARRRHPRHQPPR